MKNPIKIKIIGVGGSGCNAVLRMKRAKIEDVELIAINTDYDDLKKSQADTQIRIGNDGMGTGMNPKIAKVAAEESKDEIKKVIEGADLVFITGGLGGGTGSGASPVVASISKELGILTIGIVTLPFSFEGRKRKQLANKSKKELKKSVDALITIENDKLIESLDLETSVEDAFWACDDILRKAVSSISDLVLSSGIVNVDFADVKSILEDSGSALFGIGRAEGKDRAQKSIQNAINSPLINCSIKGAKGVLFNVAGEGVSLTEVEKIGKIISEKVDSKAKVIFGVSQDKKIKKGEIKISLIVTGF